MRQPHSVKPTQSSLATLPLSISRDENSTRSACIYHNGRFLVHLTHWNYLSAQVWAMSMDFVNPSRVKRFYQNEACQGDTICFPNHFFFQAVPQVSFIVLIMACTSVEMRKVRQRKVESFAPAMPVLLATALYRPLCGIWEHRSP